MTTRDEVLAMAREAGFTPIKDEWVFIEMLERFHALAVAKERERGVPVSVSLLRTAKDYIESASTPALLTEQRAYEWRRSRDVFVAEIDQAIDRARSAK